MKKKNYLIIIVVVLVICFIGIIFLFMNNKNNKDYRKEIEVSGIEKISTLAKPSATAAVNLIKGNTVKVINKINDKKTIIGTGFFHESGYLVTNSHIVDIAGEIIIEYLDGTQVSAQLESNDIKTDIALLSVDNPKAKAMTFGSTLSLNITDEVYAIGYPYALEGEASVSKGILSARRTAGDVEFLQLDISLNTGNSGGPLINAIGELIGINTYATSNASIGMAISSDSLSNIIDILIKNKKYEYLEDKREQNALSVVLKEIGYEDKDLYDEEELFAPPTTTTSEVITVPMTTTTSTTKITKSKKKTTTTTTKYSCADIDENDSNAIKFHSEVKSYLNSLNWADSSSLSDGSQKFSIKISENETKDSLDKKIKQAKNIISNLDNNNELAAFLDYVAYCDRSKRDKGLEYILVVGKNND